MRKKVGLLIVAPFILLMGVQSVSAAASECEVISTEETYADYKEYVSSYETPVVTFGGPVVYDRALTSGDFSIEQDQNNVYTRDVYEKTYYKSAPIGATYSCPESESELIENDKVYKRDTTTRNGTAQNITVTAYSDEKLSNGRVRYRAVGSRNGKSSTVYEYSYWVASVNITAGSKEDYYFKDYAPSASCKITYGNGVVKDCSSGDRDDAGTNTLNTNKRNSVVTGITHPSFDAFLAKNANNGVLTQPTGFAERISSGFRNVAIERSKLGSYSGASSTTVRGATQTKSEYGFGDIYVFGYKDKHTGKQDVEANKAWKSAAVDVEDETRSKNKKEVYAMQRMWDGKPYEKDILTDVTCQVYYFGPMNPKDCKSDVQVIQNVAHKGYVHEHGTEIIEGILMGNPEIPGNEYEYIKYIVEATDDYILTDSDYRTIIHVTKVQVNEAIRENIGGVTDHTSFAEERDVVVKETHVKGVKTPKDYPGGHEDYVWHAYEEQYENFVMPTCEKTFAASPLTGERRVDNCQSDLFYQYAQLKNFGKEHDYELGNDIRKGDFSYLENGYYAYVRYNFHYAMDVDIEISDDYTYQDEPYPSITCTKTYTSLSMDRSCLDTMYIDKDTGQNDNMGGEREITYKYVNNDFSDEESMTRVYANDATIANPARTEGISGSRQAYQCSVDWQDSTTIDVTYRPTVWTSDILGSAYIPGPKTWENLAKKETMNFIGESWANGYVDKKGIRHQPNSINEFYVPDPISKQYRINCEYPKTSYNNGLPPWSYAGDVYASKKDAKPFYVIGVDEVAIWDDTNQFHGSSNGGDGIDTNSNGDRISNRFGNIQAGNYSGDTSNRPPSTLSATNTKSFNNKTYQTGHWYDFEARVKFDPSPTTGAVRTIALENVGDALPEATFSYTSNAQPGSKQSLPNAANFRIDANGYPVSKYATTDTQMPRITTDHRVPQDGWNGIRFDFMTETGLPSPTGQNNASVAMKSRLFEEAWYWSHSPLSMRIEGPRGTGGSEQPPTGLFGTDYTFQSKLLWSDGYEKDQALYNGDTVSGKYIGNNNNPWGAEHKEPMNVTGLNWTGWKATEYGDVTTNQNEITFRFEDFQGNNNKRTVASWWGDAERGAGYVGAGFRYWDYFFQEIEVLIDDAVNACADIDVPKRDCPLPIDGTDGNNYRMPQNDDIGVERFTIFGIDFNVTGVSKGDGR